MPIVVIHRGLANSASLFLAILTVWAFVQFFRSRPLGPSWYGAAVVAEILLLAQFVVGGILFFEGLQAGPRPWIHILYGTVAIIALPAAHTYFGKLEDTKIQALAMALSCAFLWGIVQRAGQVITLQVPY
jgi:heme A synthase